MKRIVVLISGQGTNMLAVADACQARQWPAQVAAVVSNRPEAAGLPEAARRGIATGVVDHRAFGSREAFEAGLMRTIDGFGADVLLLAGFMRVLSPAFVQRYEGRMLNIHPSLLPAFPGLHTHRRALEAGCKLAGATVHFVTPDLDQGPIVLQGAVPVLPADDEAALARRVLAVEHRIYPLAVEWLVHGRLQVSGAVVHQLDGHAQWLWATAAGAGVEV